MCGGGGDLEGSRGRGGGLTCEIASSTCGADWSVAEGIVELESFICQLVYVWSVDL